MKALTGGSHLDGPTINYGRHPVPRLSCEQERNHMSMWPRCFWVEVGSSRHSDPMHSLRGQNEGVYE